MERSKKFHVAAVGFSASERHLLTRIFFLTEKRKRRYELTSSSEAKDIDILIVNLYEGQVKIGANTLRNTPVITLSPKKTQYTDYNIEKPIRPTHLIKILDDITIAELSFSPETFSDIASKDQVNTPLSIKPISKSADIPPHHSTGQYSVLVVDDSNAVCQALASKLNQFNIETKFANSGEEALFMLQRQPFNLIMLDITLPGINGYEVCKSIKGNTFLKNIPVCMLTGKTSSINKIKGKMAGCDNYLTKPVSNQDLMLVVTKYLPALSRREACA